MSIFSQVEVNKPKSNIFDLAHDNKLSTKIGQLTPVFALDCVPGDSIKVKSSAMVRFAPLIAPIMHRVNVYMHYFFVPNRIVWPDQGNKGGWENFITGGEDGNDTTTWANGKWNTGDDPGSLGDFLGLPTNADIFTTAGNYQVNALPFAAYQKIYNDYYRDQNLQPKAPDECEDGEQDPALWGGMTKLRTRAWQHDYFTSALPWTQKGPEAMLPLGSEAPVTAYQWLSPDQAKNQQKFRQTSDNAVIPNSGVESDAQSDIKQTGGSKAYIDLQESHYADLSQATASSINDLRRAFKLQVWLERNARGGSRYNESIAIHFGVISSDKRLQRPEFVGGSKTPVQISEVLQTGTPQIDPATGDPYPNTTTPQANMAGHAISVGSGKSYSYRCEEHGYLIGIMSIMPVTGYQQGIPKSMLRSDKFDYYWPEFAHIGEQPILNKEVITDATDPDYEDGVFGYIPRYAEYKFMNNKVHGDFKKSLNFWHMSRLFDSQVGLNADFIECDYEEVERVFAVKSTDDNMWCHVYNDIKAKRLMPVFGTPKIN